MPPPSKLSLLPAEVLAALDERLRRSAFSDYQGHASWLRGLGHDVGRSAINHYAQLHRERIDEGVGPQQVDRRIECLKVAASMVPAYATEKELCEAAAALFQWAMGEPISKGL